MIAIKKYFLYIATVNYTYCFCRFLLFFTLFYLANPQSISAQVTEIEGFVKDASTLQPISYVTVSFKGTRLGTTTDTSGYFKIATSQAFDTLQFSSIGYQTVFSIIIPFEKQKLEIELSPSDYTISEVVISPDDRENPAHPIIRAVLANKDKNNRENLEAFQYEAYSKTEFGLKGVDEKFKKQMLLGAFDFIMDYVDTLEGDDYLPMMIVESLSDLYVRRKPKAKRELIKATKVSGVENVSFSQWMGDMNHFTNIYDNRLELLGRQFVSPISNAGFNFYKYYLTDSAWVNSRWCYEIEFKPKRKQEAVFVGNMWVDTATYAIADFDFKIAGDANINYVKEIRLTQTFDYVDGAWMMDREKMFVEGHVPIPHLGKNQPFSGKRIATYKDFVVNQPKTDEFYAPKFRQVVAPDALQKSEQYWAEMRHEKLSKREESVYQMVDSVKNTPFFRLIKTMARGYARVGQIELGPFFSFYSYNPIEGHRFRVGGRTNKYFSKRTQIEAYAAYGTLDQNYKYGATFRHLVSLQPRQEITLSYKHDMEQLGRSPSSVLRQDNVLNAVFTRNPLDKMNLVDEYKASHYREWLPGLYHRLTLSHRNLSPRGTLAYKFQDANGDSLSRSSISTSEMTLHLHYGIKEEFIDYEFSRISLGSWYPMFDVLYTKGVSNVFGSDYDYHKLVLGVREYFRLGYLGELSTRVEGGKIWGTLPFPLLEIHNGNESIFYDELSFNSMNFFEFVSDEYASASVSWYPQGLFLNRIPLIRKLKWREVVSAKAVVGKLNPANERQILLPENMYSLEKPFVEASVGITNILTFIRVDALWRLTHLHHPNIAKFGVFVTAEFGL